MPQDVCHSAMYSCVHAVYTCDFSYNIFIVIFIAFSYYVYHTHIVC